MSVFSTHLLHPSVSWRNAGLYRGMVKMAHLAAYASRDETSPGPHYGLRTKVTVNAKAKQSKVKLGEGCSLYAHQIFKQ